MTINTMELTPAQVVFLRKNIAGFDVERWSVESAGAAGSDRRFLRIRAVKNPDVSYVLVLWDSADRDWTRFLSVNSDVQMIVGFLPRIYGSDDAHGLILEEDLGAATVWHVCADATHSLDEIEGMYRSVIDALVSWQRIDPSASAAIRSRSMDVEMFLWETGYFATHCVKEFFGCEDLLDAEWERQRQAMAAQAASLAQVCIHRDFQSENVLVCKGAVRFVDYQGARLGPAGYDLASLLGDPYVELLAPEIVERLLEYYRVQSSRPMPPDEYTLCAAQRLMQALGAYANLSLHKGKDRYRAFIPPALQRLDAAVRGFPEWSRIAAIAQACLGKASQHQTGAPAFLP